jgi:hypothetical protein
MVLTIEFSELSFGGSSWWSGQFFSQQNSIAMANTAPMSPQREIEELKVEIAEYRREYKAPLTSEARKDNLLKLMTAKEERLTIMLRQGTFCLYY